MTPRTRAAAGSLLFYSSSDRGNIWIPAGLDPRRSDTVLILATVHCWRGNVPRNICEKKNRMILGARGGFALRDRVAGERGGYPGVDYACLGGAGGALSGDSHSWSPASSSPDASLPDHGSRCDIAQSRCRTGASPGLGSRCPRGSTAASLRSAAAPQRGLSNVRCRKGGHFSAVALLTTPRPRAASTAI